MAAPRMPKPKIFAFAAPALLVVIIVGWFVGSLFNLAGPLLWLVRGLIWAIGFFVVYLVLRLVQRRDDDGSSEPDAIEGVLAQARKRLASSGVTGRGALSKLPLVFILGRSGSTKTTLVLQSGLEAEHLAGNVQTGEGVAPTEDLNLWYHENHVLLEAAGHIAAEPARFTKLVHRTLPSRWIPALLGKPQAPRVAVVCVSCEDLVQGVGSDGATAAAADFQARLAELSSAMGVRLPVYVVFTKADRIPHFTEYAQGFTDADVRDVLGATLSAVEDPEATSHVQRESKRLGAAFEELFRSLASRRLSVLSRGAEDVTDRVYEFPREFRKLSVPAIQYLVELTKPSQLRVSPFLRGFYFTGVRPMVVSGEAAGSMRPPEATAQAAPDAGATEVFNLRELRAASAPAAPPQARGERRIPQWVFMERILSQAVLNDALALGMTQTGTGLRVRRRLAMAGMLVLTLLLGVSTLFAYRNDRRLLNEVAVTIAEVQPLRSAEPDLPSQEDLERLDRLGRVTATLSAFENGRRPARRWLWLYSGERLYTLARRAYFDRFRPLLFDRAYRDVIRTLDDTPDEPTLDQYDRVYQALKAYVEMTVIPDSARGEFFAPVLTSHWSVVETPDSTRRALATSQFELYGNQLPYGNPYSDPSDDLRVNTSRTFLADNTTEDSFYRSLLGQWNRLPAVRFNQDFEGSSTYVRTAVDVPGAFTRAGWDSVRVSLEDTGAEFSLDAHVVGDDFFRNLRERLGFDPREMAPELISRYERDYIDAWLAFLGGATLNFPGIPRSEEWLETLASGQSPSLQMLTVVAQNTRVSEAVRAVFAPVHALTAPDSLAGEGVLFSVAGASYLANLGTLAGAMGALAGDPGNADAAADARSAARAGRGFVEEIARDFPNSPPQAAAASTAVRGVLRSPFDAASASTSSGVRIAANNILRQFCSQGVASVLQRYPFRADGPEATLGDVTALFHPEDGGLEPFFTELEAVYPSPGPSYRAFKDRGGRIARTLFEGNGPEPKMSFGFRVQRFDGISSVSLNVDGRTYEFSTTRAATQTVEWDAGRAEAVMLAVRDGDRAETLTFQGKWAIFRLFHLGDWEDVATRVYRVSWLFPEVGATVEAEVRLRGEDILDQSYFDDFRCPSGVTG